MRDAPLFFAQDLPSPLWPAPLADGWSPFSLGSQDYVRPAGPGVFVGCAYRGQQPAADLREEDFVYFVIVRQY